MTMGSPRKFPLSLLSLNHISLNCRSVPRSVEFYTKVLGFQLIKRPSFNFNGAWLFNYGIGIHLLECNSAGNLPEMRKIEPTDNHISFQCQDMEKVEDVLKKMEIDYVRRTVEEEGVTVEQLFIHDPDGYVVELCNCDNFPVVPLRSDSDWPFSLIIPQDHA